MFRTLMAVTAVSGLMLSTALAEMKTDANHAAKNSAASVKAVTAQQPNQWLGSTLIGMTVVDPDNNTIGEVDDLLVEKDGQIHALIIGVGGFLGIGEKDVALPMSAFKVVPANRNANPANSAANTAANTTSTADRLQLSMTKDQLKQHAEFKGMSSRQTTGSGAGSSAPPRNQAAPAARDSNPPPKAGDKPESSR